jgi:hypothetical protein
LPCSCEWRTATSAAKSPLKNIWKKKIIDEFSFEKDNEIKTDQNYIGRLVYAKLDKNYGHL